MVKTLLDHTQDSRSASHIYGYGKVSHAMVLAAGLGKRMRPLSTMTPKPLIKVGNKALIDYAMEKLSAAGVQNTVVNVHYLADQLEAHVKRHPHGMDVAISDERDALLETGGGVTKALSLLGAEPFFLTNSDSFWLEGARANLLRLQRAFDPAKMDALLLVAPASISIGHAGKGDFLMDADGLLERRPAGKVAPFIYSGTGLFHPRMFEGAPDGSFSMNVLFDRALEAGRLFGLRLDGLWLHVGTPQAIGRAERAIVESTG